jgi:hypothetical protein
MNKKLGTPEKEVIRNFNKLQKALEVLRLVMEQMPKSKGGETRFGSPL